jgi:glycosyltransferase involved in cell wall biosynthesis
MFRASVIIPSHQRAALLPRTLESLARQNLPFPLFEVIVAADCCTDRTEQVVQEIAVSAPYRLRLVSHNRQNASATRNLGARYAEGEILIFLDDDVEADPSLVSAHLSVHGQKQKLVSVGYLRLALPERPSQWHLEARLWWEDRYREMRQPGYRFGYRDLFSGNCAMPAYLFQECGGFSEDFPRLEDYEFGFRLLQSGGGLVHLTEAAGLHHDSTDVFKWMRRIRDEGAADVRLGERHPVLRRKLFGVHPLGGLLGQVQKLAFLLQGNGDSLVSAGLRIALLFERLRLRRRRNSIVHALKFFNYWRGVATEIKSLRALTEWTEEETNAWVVASDAPAIDWGKLPETPDLLRILSEGSRKGLRVLMDGIEVLRISAEPGSQSLTLQNVEMIIRRRCTEEIVPALVPASLPLRWHSRRKTDSERREPC